MSEVAPETKELILKLNNRIPPEKREAFSRALKPRLESLASTNTAGHALAGALMGALVDAVPGSGFISDDWVEIGAALGGWVGYAKDRKEREERERIRGIVWEAMQDALE